MERGQRAASAYEDRIVTDPRILAGKPVVKGTRISVELVLEQLAYNPDLEELFAAYPRLTRDDVRACLAYAQEAVAIRRSQPMQESAPAVSHA
jgi:uncharacterized protein (DUF433 family)